MSVEKSDGILEFEFKGKTRKLKTYKWMPSGEVRALLFLCHGYGEGLLPYYDGVAMRGAEQGVLCFGHDHTGHGDSEGPRVQVSHMDEYISPILEHCNKYKMEYPALPLFILGHSMGGLLTVVAALEDDKKAVPIVNGILLVGPLVEVDPNVASPFLKFLARLLCRIFPNFSLSGIKKDSITTSQEWMEVLLADEKRWKGGLKAQHSVVLLNRLEQLATEFQKIKVPMIIMHGENDRICTPSGSQQLHDQASSTDKTLTFYKDAMHNLLIEVEETRTKCFNQIWTWVLQRVNTN